MLERSISGTARWTVRSAARYEPQTFRLECKEKTKLGQMPYFLLVICGEHCTCVQRFNSSTFSQNFKFTMRVYQKQMGGWLKPFCVWPHLLSMTSDCEQPIRDQKCLAIVITFLQMTEQKVSTMFTVQTRLYESNRIFTMHSHF